MKDCSAISQELFTYHINTFPVFVQPQDPCASVCYIIFCHGNQQSSKPKRCASKSRILDCRNTGEDGERPLKTLFSPEGKFLIDMAVSFTLVYLENIHANCLLSCLTSLMIVSTKNVFLLHLNHELMALKSHKPIPTGSNR